MRRSANSSHTADGFTLIEVLAALIIIAIGMLAVIKGVNETVRNSAYLRDKSLAHWIAMNRLAEIRLASRVPEVAKTSGDLEFAGQRWRWKMNVTQTQVQSMRRIDINVRRDGMPEKSSLAAITGFYGTAVERPGVVSTAQSWALVPTLTGDPNDPNNPNNQNQPNPNDSASNPEEPAPDIAPPLPENVPPDPPTGPVPAPGED